MSEDDSIAIISGGGSGIGLAVGAALASRGGWTIHLLDQNEANGIAAAKEIGAEFHKVDVTDYNQLSAAFEYVFRAHKRLDFVFANAGIALSPDALSPRDATKDLDPPAEPDTYMFDINLKSVITTSLLAQHYFRKTKESSGPQNLVITASSASFYASPISPMYCASKHGVLGWVRSIAPGLWRQDKLRVNAICPGIVKTNILPVEMFAMFPEPLLTPISKVVEVVLMLMDNDVAEGLSLVGQTVEICGQNHYCRAQIDFCDDTMKALMGATDVDT